jgi:predicted cobalt transporter CbtA
MLLAPQVFGAPATEVAPAEEPRGLATAAPSPMLITPRVFWAILVVAVFALLALIGRLVRGARSGADAGGAAGSSV